MSDKKSIEQQIVDLKSMAFDHDTLVKYYNKLANDNQRLYNEKILAIDKLQKQLITEQIDKTAQQ